MMDHEFNRRDFVSTAAVGAAAAALGLLGKAAPWMGLLMMVALPSVASAIQQDAEYYVQEKRFGEQWKAEDNQVRMGNGVKA